MDAETMIRFKHHRTSFAAVPIPFDNYIARMSGCLTAGDRFGRLRFVDWPAKTADRSGLRRLKFRLRYGHPP